MEEGWDDIIDLDEEPDIIYLDEAFEPNGVMPIGRAPTPARENWDDPNPLFWDLAALNAERQNDAAQEQAREWLDRRFPDRNATYGVGRRIYHNPAVEPPIRVSTLAFDEARYRERTRRVPRSVLRELGLYNPPPQTRKRRFDEI